MLLDTVRSRPWLYSTAKRAQPMYFRALTCEAWLMRAALDRFGLHSWLHNPLGTVTSEELLTDIERSERHGARAETVHADRRACRRLPAHMPAGAREEFESVACARSGPGTVYRLANAAVWSADGAVITRSRALVGDLSPAIRIASRHHPIFRRPLVKSPTQVDGPIALATGPSPGNLSHWFFGVLPRLSLLQSVDPGFRSVTRILVPQTSSPFQTECLARFGVPTEKIVAAGPGTFLQSDEVWAPSFVSPAYVAPPWFLDDLRRRFVDINPGSRSPRIYISRAAAPGRRVVNEPAVIDCLRRRGFETVRLEDLPFREQVALFKGAREIVAPHGAGLAHLAFASADTRVVELFSPLYVNAMYWCLANELGLDYRCCLGAPDPRTATKKLPTKLVRADIQVDIPDLMRTLETDVSPSRAGRPLEQASISPGA